MISTRFMTAICVLLGLALVPTVIHSYAGAVVSDERRAAAIPAELAGFRSTPTDRGPSWAKRHFDSDDWMQRRYTKDGHDVVVTVVRTYDLKSIYHHPEIELADDSSFDDAATVFVGNGQERPVHLLRATGARPATAMYALLYEGRYIDDPVRFQLRTAGELLLSPRRSMTLFFAQEHAADNGASPDRTPAGTVLLAAIDAFLAQPAK